MHNYNKTFGSKDSLYATVSPIGATVVKLTYYGQDLIYPLKGIDSLSRRRGGIPICFPYFGSPTGRYSDLPRHGWLRDEKLEFFGESDNEGFFFGRSKPTKEYPWELEYRVSVLIDPEAASLKLELEVVRVDDGLLSLPAPINPGFHPYFCGDPNHSISELFASVNGKLITEFHQNAAMIASEGKVFVRSGNHNLKLSAPDCSCLVLWSDSPKKESAYFCVEPILMKPATFGDCDGGRFLQIGEDLKMTFSLAVVR